jgi:hypothetical protein
VEGRPALPAALAGRRRPGIRGPGIPHGLAAAPGRRAGRCRARRRRQLLRLGRARGARARCRAVNRGLGAQVWVTSSVQGARLRVVVHARRLGECSMHWGPGVLGHRSGCGASSGSTPAPCPQARRLSVCSMVVLAATAARPPAAARRRRRQRRRGRAGVEPGRLVSNWVVHITSPPDGRYAPLAPGPPRKYKAVRALVLPVQPPAHAAHLAPRLKARARALGVVAEGRACARAGGSHAGVRVARAPCSVCGRLRRRWRAAAGPLASLAWGMQSAVLGGAVFTRGRALVGQRQRILFAPLPCSIACLLMGLRPSLLARAASPDAGGRPLRRPAARHL